MNENGAVWVRAVAFDLDGTLVDSSGDIAAACNDALTRCGLPAVDPARVWEMVGDGARWLMARAASLAIDDASLDALVRAFIDYYGRHPVDHTVLAPGAKEALDALSSRPLALCTNKPRITTEAVLTGLDLNRRFSAVVAGGDTARQKPAPDPLLEIARRLSLDPAQLVMVGDGPQDIGCGRAAGAKTVAVASTPRRATFDTPRPDVRIESLAELPRVVATWFGD